MKEIILHFLDYHRPIEKVFKKDKQLGFCTWLFIHSE